MNKREKLRKELDDFVFDFDTSLAQFILPRLRRLKQKYLESTDSVRGLNRKTFNKMIYSFTKISKSAHIWPENEKKIQEGLDLFAKHYMSLWY